MRDIATKADGSSNLGAPEFNSSQVELENAVTAAGLTLDPGAGPDSNVDQLAQSIQRHALAGNAYEDGGSANTYVLTAIQSGFEQPSAYFDGMIVVFKAGNTNTGASQINVEGIGLVNFKKAGGGDHGAGEIGAGNLITAQYFAATNRFEEVANTTPEITGPAKPDQAAIYTDAGTATGVVLTIVPGFIQPSAFTDQMSVLFKSNAQNNGTGSHQIQVTGLGTKDVVEQDGADPVQGRFEAGDWVLAVFRSVRDKFEIAFVYSNPAPPLIQPAVVTGSSGTLFELGPAAGAIPPTSYQDGMVIVFETPTTNTGGVDINYNNLGNRDLRKQDGANFASGEIPGATLIVARYRSDLDDFRALSGAKVLSKDIHRDGFSTRSSSVSNGTIGPNQTVNLNWNTPDFDDSGFYDAGDDNFVVPSGQGIERIDICLNIRVPANAGDGYSVAVSVGAEVIAVQSVAGTAPAEGISMTMLDVPVVGGETIESEIDINASSARSITFANMVVRVSKFDD